MRTATLSMDKIYLVFISLLLALTIIVNANNISEKNNTFNIWKAGTVVSLEFIKHHGIDNCFEAVPVSDAVFTRMYGKSFKKDCTIPRAQLRYLRILHHDGNGNILMGEIVCNKTISADLIDIFRRLYDAKYPIERIQLIDDYNANDITSMEANNSSCFNFRKKTNPALGLSKHALGLAIDINPLYNPYYKKKKDGTIVVEPDKGRPYINRQKDFKYKINKNDLCYKLFIEHGFTWGGNWQSSKDYQHFEK